MRETRTSGLMSGGGKRVALAIPRPSSTLLRNSAAAPNGAHAREPRELGRDFNLRTKYQDSAPPERRTIAQPFEGCSAIQCWAATALILAPAFRGSPDFRLNVQRRTDLWEAMNSPRWRHWIERATPLRTAT